LGKGQVTYDEELTDKVIDFLEQHGIDIGYKKFTNYNVQLRCPFAKVSGHRGGQDRNPSFGLKVQKGVGFLYNCFTCGRKGRSLVQFIEELQLDGLIDAKLDAYKLQNAIHPVFPEYGNNDVRDNPEIVVEKIPGTKDSKHPRFIWYHRDKRKVAIRPEILSLLDVRYSEKRGKVIFPVYDWKKRPKGYVEHNMEKEFPKYSNEINKSENLYLEWMIRKKVTSTAIVVEGMYDAIVTYQHLYDLRLLNIYNVVAMFGSKVGASQMNLLTKYFTKLLLYGDNDEAGILMEHSIYKYLRNKLPAMYKLSYVGGDPADVSLQQFKRIIEKPKPFNLIV